MIAGVFEKIAKAKRQQQPPPPPSYDDFEDVDTRTAPPPPQTIEELMKRMMQTVETSKQESVYQTLEGESLEGESLEGESLENTPAMSFFHYTPIATDEQSEKESLLLEPVEAENDASEFVFNIRQAVIASEILNRKY